MNEDTQNHEASVAETVTPQATSEAVATQSEPSVDAGNEKLFAIVGYVIPFLFFLPLVQDDLKGNAFSRFHANQQLILLGLWVGLWILNNVFFMVLYFVWFAIAPLLSLVLIVLAIVGIMNASKNEMKALPVVGSFTLLK